MEKLIAEWKWPRERIYSLDARNKWKAGRVMDEQKELVRELTNSYRHVLDFARHAGAASHRFHRGTAAGGLRRLLARALDHSAARRLLLVRHSSFLAVHVHPRLAVGS